MRKASIEQVIREHLTDNIRESDLVEAIMLMHGWLDGRDYLPGEVARITGIDIDQLRPCRDLTSLGLYGKTNAPLNEALEYITAHLPLAHDELEYYLGCELGVLEGNHFSVLSLMYAAEAYGLQPAFKSISKELHKWLVDVTDTSIVDFAENWIRELVKQAQRDCIVHLAQVENLSSYMTGDFSFEQFWQVINACPRLSTGAVPYIFARRPDRSQPLIKRIDRLLSWCFPHKIPVDVAFRQVFRDQSKIDIMEDSDVGITRQQAFTGFLVQSDYYDAWIDGVSLVNEMPVDTVLTATERRVIEHLIGMEGGVEIDDLKEFARFVRCSELELQKILLSSPLVSTDDGLVFRGFDQAEIGEGLSPWDEVNRFPFWQVWMTPGPNSAYDHQLSPTDELSAGLEMQLAQHEAIDLASLSWDSWIGVYPGQLSDDLLTELETNNQKWTPVIDQHAKRCVGVVKTKRLRNKLTNGNKQIDLDDVKLKGIELDRHVSRQELNDALAASFCVYFTDAPGSWGVVFQRDL